MKKLTILILLSLAFSLTTNAQPQGKPPHDWKARREFSPEEFKRHMQDFVKSEAQLTCQEADKLFPILFEMLSKQRQILDQQRQLMRSAWNKELSEKEYENIVLNSNKLDIQANQLEETYYKRFHSIISWKKIFKVKVALYRFKMEALNKFKPGQRNKKPNTSD